jgi:hypothetical protein
MISLLLGGCCESSTQEGKAKETGPGLP